MTMIQLENHPWLESILYSVDDPSLPLDENNPLWDFIDSAIASMGTINHNQIDIEKVQNHALLLLKETKDMRVIAHLLRTLQHAKKPQDIVLAFYFFSVYITKYWLVAAPQPKLKNRLFKQITQRFAQANKPFEVEATIIEKKYAVKYLTAIKDFFESNQQPLDDDFCLLMTHYHHLSSQIADTDLNQPTHQAELPTQTKPQLNTRTESKHQVPSTQDQSVSVNHNSESEWKRTLIKVAEILFERSPDNPIGPRLRRHAIFSSLSEPIHNNNVTELMPMPADRVNEYKANMTKMTIEQWIKIENELTLMPFWLEGHFISATIALNLDFTSVADAILEELQLLLERVPKLQDLKYSDQSPFISQDMKRWLMPKNQTQQNTLTGFEEQVFHCYEENGLEQAIDMIEKNSNNQELRNKYHYQKINTQLLAYAGFKTVAKQQASSILTACENMTLSEWEPSFIETLTQLTNINN